MKKTFGKRYEIIEKIGTGGMADVYKARDSVLERTVAIKVLHAQFAQDENFIARFKREAKAAANLSHPNIVSIYDWGEEGGTYFLAMEYLEGENLKEIIERRGVLPPDEAIKITSKVASALEAAHKRDVIHRDIKPHNVILTPDGKIKVTDFGIARAGASSTMTQTGSIVGTAQYISPEQAQGLSATYASDIYSLGVVLYEMLTGNVPFEGDNPVAVALKHVNDELTPPRDLNPSIPKYLEQVVLHALAKNPEERYASAEEFQKDLAAVAEGLPIKKRKSTDKTLVMPAAEAKEAYERPPRRPKKKRKVLLWALLILAAVLVGILGAWGLSTLMGKTVVVPSVEGKTVSEAREILEKKGLELKVEERAYSDTVKKGRIISQDPEWGEKIKEGGTVKVIVSKGKKTIGVPGLEGKTLDEATYILAKAGLEVGEKKYVFSDTVPEDTVISQDPKAGEEVKRGTKVDLVISKGQEEVEVPDVVGKTASDAATILGQAGFRIDQREEESDTVDKGKVIRQSPSGGTIRKKGSTVTIVVSKGVEVPNVIGELAADATSTLTNKGFNVNSLTRPSPGDVGKVVDQDPNGGTFINRGSTVTIWVGT